MSRGSRLLATLTAVTLATLVGALLLLIAGVPGGGGDGAPTAAEATLVFAEFGPTADRVYTAPAADPARRALVATIEHAAGWGINPAPRMAGTLVAYTVLPSGGPPRRDAPAELWLLDVATRDRTRLARDADLLAAPQFDQRGEYLLYRSSDPGGGQTLVRVEVASRLRRSMVTSSGGFGVYPIGFDGGGAVVYAGLSTAGTDLYRIVDGGEVEHLLHASDHIARGWRLSPDGRLLTFLAPELRAERMVHRLQLVDLQLVQDGAGSTPTRPAGVLDSADQFGPVWTPGGRGITVGREAYPGLRAGAVTYELGADGIARALPPPAAGFDVPLGWSPDGRFLAARSFDGDSAYRAGTESMVVIAVDGARHAVTARNELIFLGWIGQG